jgi:hypothetical protein
MDYIDRTFRRYSDLRCAALLLHLSGTLGVRMDDGTQFECRPGELAILPPGHDAWVVVDEPVVVLELEGIRDPTRFGD